MSASRREKTIGQLGPAIIVACVVLGPGSILTNSKVGARFGYELTWVLVLAVLLMMAMTSLSLRLGVHLRGTLCDELANRAGRPLAAITGITLFLIAACYQFGNNLGLLYALEPWLENGRLEVTPYWPAFVLIGLNAGLVAALVGLRSLYRPVERLMKLLVALMLIGFAVNLFHAGPSWMKLAAGLLPWPGWTLEQGWWRDEQTLMIVALVGTTFSVAGAFYQSYLVRQKGWSPRDAVRGNVDTIVGIAALGMMSLMIMVTAATVLHGATPTVPLNTAADVARQLGPLFGPWASACFCMGIFAGAFSSLLLNAMVGGTVLADGLGYGGRIDDWAPRLLTIVVLVLGVAVALTVKFWGLSTGNLIIFAQALTVLGNPLLAGVMLWLAGRANRQNPGAVPRWNLIASLLGMLVVLVLSLITAVTVAAKLFAAG